MIEGGNETNLPVKSKTLGKIVYASSELATQRKREAVTDMDSRLPTSQLYAARMQLVSEVRRENVQVNVDATRKGEEVSK